MDTCINCKNANYSGFKRYNWHRHKPNGDSIYMSNKIFYSSTMFLSMLQLGVASQSLNINLLDPSQKFFQANFSNAFAAPLSPVDFSFTAVANNGSILAPGAKVTLSPDGKLPTNKWNVWVDAKTTNGLFQLTYKERKLGALANGPSGISAGTTYNCTIYSGNPADFFSLNIPNNDYSQFFAMLNKSQAVDILCNYGVSGYTAASTLNSLLQSSVTANKTFANNLIETIYNSNPNKFESILFAADSNDNNAFSESSIVSVLTNPNLIQNYNYFSQVLTNSINNQLISNSDAFNILNSIEFSNAAGILASINPIVAQSIITTGLPYATQNGSLAIQNTSSPGTYELNIENISAAIVGAASSTPKVAATLLTTFLPTNENRLEALNGMSNLSTVSNVLANMAPSDAYNILVTPLAIANEGILIPNGTTIEYQVLSQLLQSMDPVNSANILSQYVSAGEQKITDAYNILGNMSSFNYAISILQQMSAANLATLLNDQSSVGFMPTTNTTGLAGIQGIAQILSSFSNYTFAAQVLTQFVKNTSYKALFDVLNACPTVYQAVNIFAQLTPAQQFSILNDTAVVGGSYTSNANGVISTSSSPITSTQVGIFLNLVNNASKVANLFDYYAAQTFTVAPYQSASDTVNFSSTLQTQSGSSYLLDLYTLNNFPSNSTQFVYNVLGQMTPSVAHDVLYAQVPNGVTLSSGVLISTALYDANNTLSMSTTDIAKIFSGVGATAASNIAANLSDSNEIDLYSYMTNPTNLASIIANMPVNQAVSVLNQTWSGSTATGALVQNTDYLSPSNIAQVLTNMQPNDAAEILNAYDQSAYSRYAALDILNATSLSKSASYLQVMNPFDAASILSKTVEFPNPNGTLTTYTAPLTNAQIAKVLDQLASLTTQSAGAVVQIFTAPNGVITESNWLSIINGMSSTNALNVLNCFYSNLKLAKILNSSLTYGSGTGYISNAGAYQMPSAVEVGKVMSNFITQLNMPLQRISGLIKEYLGFSYTLASNVANYGEDPYRSANDGLNLLNQLTTAQLKNLFSYQAGFDINLACDILNNGSAMSSGNLINSTGSLSASQKNAFLNSLSDLQYKAALSKLLTTRT